MQKRLTNSGISLVTHGLAASLLLLTMSLATACSPDRSEDLPKLDVTRVQSLCGPGADWYLQVDAAITPGKAGQSINIEYQEGIFSEAAAKQAGATDVDWIPAPVLAPVVTDANGRLSERVLVRETTLAGKIWQPSPDVLVRISADVNGRVVHSDTQEAAGSFGCGPAN